ncbi:MAG: glycogen/starch synthase [Pseudomonadota bacterium]
MPRASHTLFITQELLPFHATGGMAVLSRDLPEALNREGWQHSYLLPFIKGVSALPVGADPQLVFEKSVAVGDKEYSYRVLLLARPGDQCDVYLVEQEAIFSGQLYNDAHRLARNVVVGDAALALLEQEDSDFRLVHALDQLSALSLAYIRALSGERYGLIFNILSAEYDFALGPMMGETDFARREQILDVVGSDIESMTAIELGMAVADTAITSSPAYAKVLADKYRHARTDERRLIGINQGIDIAVWDPHACDRAFYPIHAETLEKDKDYNRAKLDRILQEQPRFCDASPEIVRTPFGKTSNNPRKLLSFIGRFCRAKGRAALYLLLDRLDEYPDIDLLFIIPKGSLSDVDVQKLADRAAAEPRLTVINDYDQSFAELAFAASDFILMPSEQEPGGLCQKIAMRFGSLPLVTPVGGLKTSVIDLRKDRDSGNGFVSQDADPESFLEMIGPVLAIPSDEPMLAKGRRQAMATDVSWQKTVSEYAAIYETLDHNASAAKQFA